MLTSDVIRGELDEATAAELEAFLSAAKANYRQRPDWQRANPGTDFLWCLSRDDGRIVASSLVELPSSALFFDRHANLVRGPVVVESGTSDYLVRHLEHLADGLRNDATAITRYPWAGSQALPDEWQAGPYVAFNTGTVRVPVLADEGEQWRTLRRSTRTAINRGRREEMSIHSLESADELDRFTAAFNRFAASRSITGLDEGLLARLAASGIDLVVLQAEHDNETAGGAAFVSAGGRLIYEWGFTEASKIEAGLPVIHGLIWAGIAAARERALDTVDLGGYWKERGPTDPNNRFKLGFSKDIEDFGPAQRLVLRPGAYRIGAAVRKLAALRPS